MKRNYFANEEPNIIINTNHNNNDIEDIGGIDSQIIDNNIYFYSDVDVSAALSLNKNITLLNNQLSTIQNNYKLVETPNINLHINSNGGDLFAGFSIVNYVKNSRIPIHSIIDGYAASAATLFSVVAKKRFMKEYSFILIHQLSTSFWGKYSEFEDEMTNNKLLMNQIYKIYEDHTKIPKKKLVEILKKDIWFDAKQALEYGLIDEII
jgi:ATP-dependent protease ClpP protease subunit